MENKIDREDLIEIQKDITDASNELAENVNKKHILDAGLKKSSKISMIALIFAIFGSMIVPSTFLSIILWVATISLATPTAIYGIIDAKTNLKLNDLKEKIKDLNCIQRNMQLDYELEKKKEAKVINYSEKINSNLKLDNVQFDTKKENVTTDNI